MAVNILPKCVKSAGEVVLEVNGVETPNRELGFALEIAAPLPKGDRAQFLIEKLTELGVTTFTPLQTARSVVHPRETRLEKLERYVIEASKQCGRNGLMKIGPLTTWTSYVRREGLPDRRLVAHLGESAILSGRAAPADVVAAVGPEGGFTDEEVEQARRSGMGNGEPWAAHPAHGNGGYGNGDFSRFLRQPLGVMSALCFFEREPE